MALSSRSPDGSASMKTIARMNRSAIVRALRNADALTRQDLATVTGLSNATVSRLTDALVKAGEIEGAGTADSTGGRRPIYYKFAGHRRSVLSVEINETYVRAMLVDLSGTIRRRHEFSLEKSTTLLDNLRTYRAVVASFLATSQDLDTQIISVGTTVAGVVQPDGEVFGMQGWEGLVSVDLTVDNLPTVVENNANALVMGEMRDGVGVTARHYAGLLLTQGIGAGIVTNGELYRGSTNAAGEVGYLLAEERESPSVIGELEALVSAPSLREQFGMLRGGEVPGSASDALGLLGSSDADVRSVAERVLDSVEAAAAAICTVLDPDCLVLGGVGNSSAEHIARVIADHLRDRINRVPPIFAASHGADAVLVGGVVLAEMAAVV